MVYDWNKSSEGALFVEVLLSQIGLKELPTRQHLLAAATLKEDITAVRIIPAPARAASTIISVRRSFLREVV